MQKNYINLRFPIEGHTIVADHGYLLFSAISHLIPQFHSASWFAIEMISGTPIGQGKIHLRKASFSIRLPAENCNLALPLAGKKLEIGQDSIQIGIPFIKLLEPCSSLYARIVVIKNFTEPETFLQAVEKQLAKLEIEAKIELPLDTFNRARRKVISVQKRKIIGFSLAVHELSQKDSLALQINGLGGKRHMGCGIFNPISERVFL